MGRFQFPQRQRPGGGDLIIFLCVDGDDVFSVAQAVNATGGTSTIINVCPNAEETRAVSRVPLTDTSGIGQRPAQERVRPFMRIANLHNKARNRLSRCKRSLKRGIPDALLPLACSAQREVIPGITVPLQSRHGLRLRSFQNDFDLGCSGLNTLLFSLDCLILCLLRDGELSPLVGRSTLIGLFQ